jgi:outer membrane receptor for ferrienterochelin and colicins
MRHYFPLAVMALAIGHAYAQTEAEKKEPAPAAPQSQVTVTGTRGNDVDQRRMATASKLIFGREELDRNGDSSVSEILKRLPGVTLGGGRPGRGGQVRMRGLGNGYTQMLVNGERAPAGFSLDSLTPDQVERIEVIRGPVAEHSTQAIAGTINIVLREGYQQKDIQLRVADNYEHGRHGINIGIGIPGKTGDLTWIFNGNLQQNRRFDESFSDTVDISPAGTVLREQSSQERSEGKSRGIHLAPRLSYRFDNGDTLTFQPFLMNNRNSNSARTELQQTPATALPLPEYNSMDGRSESENTFLRGFGNWLHRMEKGRRLDVKFGFGTGKSESENRREQFNAAGVLTHRLLDSDDSSNRSLNLGGKFTSPMGEGHLLAAGWDIEAGNREQSRVSLDNGVARYKDSGANLSADTRRLAMFVQDEWDITKQVAVYLGLRWEGIRTTSANSGGDIRNTSRVWSPVLHGVWRIPGYEKDQLRASLTRSYKAPDLNDLIAVPTFSSQNEATRPDRVGNPDLKPELATGIDLAYEHYIGKTGILSASAFARNITNLIRRETTERLTENGLRWVSSPTNVGKARTAGIELEAKFQLADVMEDAPNMDVRANYSRFWSDVDGIPGPNNRLDQQAKQTANVGVDYRFKDLPLTLGGSYNWTPAIVVQTSARETVTVNPRRVFDTYALWKFSANTQLRLSASNLLHRDAENGRIVVTDRLTQFSNTLSHTYTTFGVRLELKL